MADPLAQPGTVLPDSSLDPGKVAFQRKQFEQQQDLASQKIAAQKKAQSIKNAAEMKIPEGGGEWDHVFIESKAKDMLKKFGQMIEKGEDPYDPTTEAGQRAMMMRWNLEETARQSREAHDVFDQAVKRINTDPEKFKPGSLNAWIDWIQLSPDVRATTPPPYDEAEYDYAKAKEDAIDKIGVNKAAGAYQAGANMYEWTDESLSGEDLKSAAIILAGDEDYKDWVSRKKLPGMDKIALKDLMARAQAAGISPEAQWAIDDFMLSEYKKQDRKIKGASKGALGYKSAEKQAEFFAEQAEGWATGNFSGFKPLETTSFGMTIGSPRYETSNSMRGFHLDKEGDRKMGDVIRDKETKMLAFIDEDQDPGSVNLNALDWKTPEAFFAHTMPILSEHNDEVDLGQILIAIENNEKVPWDFGNIDRWKQAAEKSSGKKPPKVDVMGGKKTPRVNLLD